MTDQPIHTDDIAILLYKEVCGETLSSRETTLLHAWKQESSYNGQVADSLVNEQVLRTALKDLYTSDKDRAWARLMARRAPAAPVRPLYRIWLRYAAVLLLIAGTATYFYQRNEGPPKDITKQPTTSTPDIPPGENKAILTLSDGSTIVLDSAANGALAQQANSNILKMDAGKLAYQVTTNAVGEIGYNTISTPKGGQYQIVLPDGTNVWLNAASSIRFPTAFEKERSVVVTGEAYLEVVPNRSLPFYVTAGSERIHVLGTTFNVNAYANEPAVTTTLLQGSVQIGATLLKPGEAYANGKKYPAKTARAIAWKNGLFDFQDAGLREVMRQLERWYDIEVIIPPSLRDIPFYGKMSRDLTLDEVLEAIKGSRIRFIMQGQTLTLLP